MVFQQTLTDVVHFLAHTNTHRLSRSLDFLRLRYSSHLLKLCIPRRFQCDSALNRHSKTQQSSCRIFAGLWCQSSVQNSAEHRTTATNDRFYYPLAFYVELPFSLVLRSMFARVLSLWKSRSWLNSRVQLNTRKIRFPESKATKFGKISRRRLTSS